MTAELSRDRAEFAVSLYQQQAVALTFDVVGELMTQVVSVRNDLPEDIEIAGVITPDKEDDAYGPEFKPYLYLFWNDQNSGISRSVTVRCAAYTVPNNHQQLTLETQAWKYSGDEDSQQRFVKQRKHEKRNVIILDQRQQNLYFLLFNNAVSRVQSWQEDDLSLEEPTIIFQAQEEHAV